MSEPMVLLDPTSERRRATGPGSIARRRSRVEPSACSTSPSPAATSSSNGLEQRLTERGATVVRYAKPTFTKPAPVDLRHEIIQQCDVVIEALAD